MFLPGINIPFFNKKIHSFHFFGVFGYLLGSLLGVCLCYFLKLQINIILLMSLVGATTFFALAFLAKIITGEENIVYYHHEIAILIICSVILKLLHLPVLNYLDITILGIAAFLAFGRIGCFSVGCCHGKPAKKGVAYSHEHVKAGFTFYYEGVALFPIQLAESAFVFLLIIAGSVLLINHFPPGTVLIIYTVVYGAFRFMVEFFRGDPERPYWKGMSEAQWTTLALITVSLVLGFAGFIPLYWWHIAIAILLWTIALYIVLKNDVESKIFNPGHIMKIATALVELDNVKHKTNNNKNAPLPINIFESDLGLRISKGQFVNEKSLTTHYAVSYKDKQQLNYALVEKLAILIRQLQKHSGEFQVEERQSGVFHILFCEFVKTETKIGSEKS